MRNILVTGGTVFVSRYVAEYFVKRGDHVFVLNRNTRQQPEGVTLIEGDRNSLGDRLKEYHFDAVLDITAYTKEDVEHLVDALAEVKQYICISSSAVYPETLPQPFREEQECGENTIWGAYGTNKIEAEKYLVEHMPQAYILRPPYLYGPMQNLYRELFVFDCAMAGRTFYIPKDGKLPLHFFHVEDLCRFMEVLLEKQPKEHIFNVGNKEITDINEWVKLCYEAVGKPLHTVYVQGEPEEHAQRSYFCFHDYGYQLDVSRMLSYMPDTRTLKEGLLETYEWYREHSGEIAKKPYIDYIDQYIQPEMKQ